MVLKEEDFKPKISFGEVSKEEEIDKKAGKSEKEKSEIVLINKRGYDYSFSKPKKIKLNLKRTLPSKKPSKQEKNPTKNSKLASDEPAKSSKEPNALPLLGYEDESDSN